MLSLPCFHALFESKCWRFWHHGLHGLDLGDPDGFSWDPRGLRFEGLPSSQFGLLALGLGQDVGVGAAGSTTGRQVGRLSLGLGGK